jgi:hypothetical protein
MPWTQKIWVDYRGRHRARGSRPWSDQVAATRSGKARYAKSIDVKHIETLALAEGHLVFEQGNVRVFYYVCDGVIGASVGEETHIVRVEWLADPLGSYHGRPITESQLTEELKAFNPTELLLYESRKQERRRIKRNS